MNNLEIVHKIKEINKVKTSYQEAIDSISYLILNTLGKRVMDNLLYESNIVNAYGTDFINTKTGFPVAKDDYETYLETICNALIIKDLVFN